MPPPTTSFSPLQIRTAETPPKPELVPTPGRELTREERKLARRRNGAAGDPLPNYAGKRLTFTLPSATHPPTQSIVTTNTKNINSQNTSNLSESPHSNLAKSLLGKHSSEDRSVIGRVKGFTHGPLLALQSPSKLSNLGPSNQPNASQSHRIKPSSQSLLNKSQSSTSANASSDGITKSEAKKTGVSKADPSTNQKDSLKSKQIATESKKRKVNHEATSESRLLEKKANPREDKKKGKGRAEKEGLKSSTTLVLKPLRETDPNLPDNSSIRRDVVINESTTTRRLVSAPVFPNDQLIFQPFQLKDSAIKPRAPSPSVGSSQVVVQRRQLTTSTSNDTQVTPTVFNSPPPASPTPSSSNSVKMKTLAAKVFSTPGNHIKNRPCSSSSSPSSASLTNAKGKNKMDSNQEEKDDHAIRKGLIANQDDQAKKKNGESEEEEDSEEIYIVADRLVRHDELDLKRLEKEEKLSISQQKLVLKVRSQLNPADIISISIRKLIQDEISSIDHHLFDLSLLGNSHLNNKKNIDKVNRLKKEKDCLFRLLHSFTNFMLRYSDLFVSYGLLKLQVQSFFKK